MNKKNLPPLNLKNSVKFDLDEVSIIDPLPPIIDFSDKINEKLENIHVAVQTDGQWLEELKKDLLSKLQTESKDQEKESIVIKSKTPTVSTKQSKISSIKSKLKSDSLFHEDFDHESVKSDGSSSAIPPYPMIKKSDEFGLALYISSDDDDENFDPEKMSQVIEENAEINLQAESKKMVEEKVTKIVTDAGLPAIFKVPKELGSTELSPPMSAEAFLENAFSPKNGEVCDFCNKPLVTMPKVKDQVITPVDQAQLFCCQQFRDLVDFALAQKSDDLNIDGVKSSQIRMIDISPHKNNKNSDENAQIKARSEKRIRERLQAREEAALLAAQAAQMKDQSSIVNDNDSNQNYPQMGSRQVQILSYQLSSYKFIEQGWTVSPQVLSNFEMTQNKEITEEVIDMDFTKSLYELFGNAKLFEECSSLGVVRHYYPSGQLFLVFFQDGNGSIYYPSGSLAVSMVRPSIDSSAICIIKEDSPAIDSKAKVLAVVNTNGFGSFSFPDESQRIVFNSLFGIELLPDNMRRRQWFWKGETHVHGPPFQPICFLLNKQIGIRISSQNAIYINFLAYTKQIHINVGCKSEVPKPMRSKMYNMVKVEYAKLEVPLENLKLRCKNIFEKWSEAFDHPILVAKNKWPIKPFNKENEVTVRLSGVK